MQQRFDADFIVDYPHYPFPKCVLLPIRNLRHTNFLVELYFFTEVQRWMNTSNPRFVGRRWLFNQLESFFEKNNDISGVVLVGDPGSGKTTIMRQLLFSQNSSRFIHDNIIAFHFCQFDNKTTHNGETFVKSLVEQLSDKVAGFEDSVQNVGAQNRPDRCKDDLIGCAQVNVLEPLNNLKMPPETKKFILIDALDECHESVIMTILQGQRIRLPSWIKLLVSCRNETTVTTNMFEIGLETIAIRATSEDNLNDVRVYAQERISQPGFQKKIGINKSIENLISQTDGNFLFIKMVLDDWEILNTDKLNPTKIPANLSDWYRLSFRKRFNKNELNFFAKFFEVLLASNSPPTLELVKNILILNKLMDDYVLDNIEDRLSAYLQFNNGVVRIFHSSFAEWLTNQNKPVDGFRIKKSRGHQYIANFLFDNYIHQEIELTVERLYELSMHVLNGGMQNEQVRKLKDLNSTIIDEYGRCILHHLARNRESTEVLKVFIEQFKSSVDIIDKYGSTPAYYATLFGNYHNLEQLIINQANVNYVQTVDFYFDVILRYHNSLIAVATKIGYSKIVELLVDYGAHFDKEDKRGVKLLDVAVISGRLKIVEFLINKTERGFSDLFTLHQAIFLNRADVLTLLLENGVRDKCMPCNQDQNDSSRTAFTAWISTVHQYLTTVCGSALNIAVSGRNLEVVKILLSYGKETLECKSWAGLTPLMHAIEINNIEMVNLLLEEGTDVEANCEIRSEIRSIWKIKRSHLIPWNASRIFSSYYYCYHASKAIHISAILGTSEITKELIRRNANQFSTDSMGWTADELAMLHNNVQHINTSVLNNITLLRYLAVCGSIKALEQLSRSKSSDVLTAVDKNGMTLLHLATLGLTNLFRFHRVCSIINCDAFKCPHMDALPHAISWGRYFSTIKLLTEVTPQNIIKKDRKGKTALHYAALVRSPEVVRHLIEKGSNWKLRDEDGNTALEFMLRGHLLYIANLGLCRSVFYSFFNSSEMAISSEAHVMCLNWLYALTQELTKQCRGNTDPPSILYKVKHYNLPLSWYILLKVDADLQCLSGNFGFFDMRRSMETLGKLLKNIKIEVKVNLQVGFDYSILHVAAYYLRPSGIDMYDQISLSMQRRFEAYLNGSHILDESYDLHGYLPIHYAAAGNNNHTIYWLINHGADIFKKTRSGWTTFHLLLTNSHYSGMLDEVLHIITSSKKYNFSSDFWCNTIRAPLSFLHIAARKGLWFLNRIRRNQFIPVPNLPFSSCSNSHGIDLLYLMKLYHDVEWKDLGLPANTTLSKYPESEAEFRLIYNMFFISPHVYPNLTNEDEILDLFRCPGINDLLPHMNIIEEQLNRCRYRCRSSASQVCRSFSTIFNSTFTVGHSFTEIVRQMAELRYHCIKMFYKVSTKLWRQVSKAYTCSFKCHCIEMKHKLQKEFTREKYFREVKRFVAERMGWNNTSQNGDVRYRWPFIFLLKKFLKMDKDYEYLDILSGEPILTMTRSNFLRWHMETLRHAIV